MRLLGRLLLAALLIGGGHGIYRYLSATWEMPAASPHFVKDLDLAAEPTTVYFLSTNRWLVFPVLSGARRVRILSRASVSAALMADADFRYTLAYELLDRAQQPLYSAQYSHKSGLPSPLKKRGHMVPSSVYATGKFPVTTAESLTLRLDGLPTVTSYIRLRLDNVGHRVRNVAVQVSYEERLSKAAAALQWTRLSAEEQVRVTEDLIYPPELSSRQEKLSLLERQWQPIGPLGSEPPQGTLFNISGADPAVGLTRNALTRDFHVSRRRLSAIPISKSGRYLLAFRALRNTHRPVILKLRHWSAELTPSSVKRVVIPSGKLRISQTLRPGLLIVKPNQPGFVDIYRAKDPKRSLLPEANYLRVYRLRQQLPVEFRLLSIGHTPTPFRLELRAYGNGTPLPPDIRMRADYRLLNDAGQVVQQGTLRAQLVPSVFDRVSDTPQIADLSEPVSFYFRLPPEVARVELFTRQSLLVNGYTRPVDLPHRTRVPEDYYVWLGNDLGQPSWFIIEPAGSQWRNERRSIVIDEQARPPERNPAVIADILAGHYEWEALKPRIGAAANYILEPLSAEDRLRPEGLPSYLRPLREGEQIIKIDAPGVDRQVNPQLFYVRDQAAPFSVELSLDGQTETWELIGRRGELSVPAVNPGNHTLALKATTKALWLMNYGYPRMNGYMERLAYRLDEHPLEFKVTKRRGDRQLISARFYSLGGAHARSNLRVCIRPSQVSRGPTREWTHQSRFYYIAPSPQEAKVGYVLDQQKGRISRGQPVLIELDNDIPAGDVTVEFSLENGAPGYLLFYEVLAGEFFDIRTFEEEAR